MALFESYERREKQILEVLAQYDIKSIEECRDICQAKGFDPYKIVEGIQPICFENAKWAYTVGCAIAIKKALNPPLRPLPLSARVFSPSAFPVQLQTKEK